MKKILAFISDLLFDIKYFLKYGNRNPLAYERVPMPKEERRAMIKQTDKEAEQFVSKINGRPPHQWSFEESAWHESIRCRQATAS